MTREQTLAARGLATIVILFAHSINDYDAYRSPCSQALLVPYWAECAVATFLALSAYGMTLSAWNHRGARPGIAWIARHLAKILRIYLVAFAACTLARIAHGHSVDPLDLLRLNMCDGNQMWFVKEILVFYIVLWLTACLFRNHKSMVIALTVITVGTIATMRMAGMEPVWFISTAGIPLGLALAYHTTHVKTRIRWHVTAAVATLLFIAINAWRTIKGANTLTASAANMAAFRPCNIRQVPTH